MPSLNKPPEYHSWIVGAEGVTGAINGKLYVVTGCYAANEPWGYDEGCDGEAGMFFRYNPATDQWASLPSPFAEPPGVGSDAAPPFAGGVIAGKLYVMGSSRWTRENHFAAYDPATNRWTTKTPLGQMRPGAAAAVLGGKLYLFGGRRFNAKLEQFETLDKTLRYDPITNLWTTRASMPSARTGIAATPVMVSGQARIEVTGGPAPGNNLQYVP
jgi:N-acetylneuraminic acid mutarotase